MKFPSFSYVVQQSLKTYFRFPFTILNTIVGSLSGIILINYENQIHEPILLNVLLATLLGIPFLISVTLFGERQGWRRSKNLLFQFIGLALLFLYGLMLPKDLTIAPLWYIVQFFILLTGMHLLAAFVSFTQKGEVNGFWQFNKTLFVQILTAVLYSGVLYLGLIIALEALRHLFGVDIPYKRYGQLWVLIAGVFNTWFFLSGIPENFSAMQESTEYPKGLKIFTQYILLPLIAVYLIILYSYAAKIIIAWDLPQGWVSKLILGFSISGILALLLIYPIKDRKENVWIHTLWKWYFFILVPLDVMLVLAIWRRISDYGITESRYIVLVLGLWLIGITIYFIVSKSKSIKIIPASLCLIAFFSSAGPWSASSISKLSQLQRLEQTLTKHSILMNGKVNKIITEIPFKDAKQISSIVKYICEMHGSSTLQPWFSVPLDTIANRGAKQFRNVYEPSKAILNLMGVRFINEWEPSGYSSQSFSSVKLRSVSIDGYKDYISFHTYSNIASQDTFQVGPQKYTINIDSSAATICLNAHGIIKDSVSIKLSGLIQSLMNKYKDSNEKLNIPQADMTIEDSLDKLKLKIIFEQININNLDDKLKINSLKGILLVGFVDKQ
jgi:hypothetical protein